MEKHSIQGIDCLKVKSKFKTDSALVLLHGYGASMHDLAPLVNYLNFHGDYFFPQGLLSVPLGPHVEGKAWFPIDMEALEKAMLHGGHRSFENLYPEPFKNTLIKLEAYINELKKNYTEIIIGGFSQGAMCSLHLAFRLKLKKLILLSANPIGLKEIDFDHHQVHFFQSHGTQDAVLSFDDSKSLYEKLIQKKSVGSFISFQGGHEIPQEVLLKLNKFLINE